MIGWLGKGKREEGGEGGGGRGKREEGGEGRGRRINLKQTNNNTL